MIRRLLLRPIAVLLGSLCLINGCHQWESETVSATSLNTQHLSSARVRMVDGRQMTILRPRVVGDSLAGHVDSIGPGPASQPRTITSVSVSVAIAQVRTVESRHVNGWKTAGVAFVAVGFMGLAVASAFSCFMCEP